MSEVILTERAQGELDQAYDWWASNRSAEQANLWYTSFIRAMLTLDSAPEQWPLAPENEFYPVEVRQLNFGLGSQPTHRALFNVRSDAVVIPRIRHLAQAPLAEEDT